MDRSSEGWEKEFGRWLGDNRNLSGAALLPYDRQSTAVVDADGSPDSSGISTTWYAGNSSGVSPDSFLLDLSSPHDDAEMPDVLLCPLVFQRAAPKPNFWTIRMCSEFHRALVDMPEKDSFVRTTMACLMLGLHCFLAGCSETEFGRDGSNSESSNVTSGTIRLALNWYPEAEHGGFFAADELGHFTDQKLDVEIIPGSPGASRLILQELAVGRTHFAIASADQVVEQRSRGLPIVALLAPLQQSPRCIIVHEASGVSSLQELASVELAISETRPFALWMKKQLPLKGVTIVPFNGLVGEFLAKPNFAQQGYVFSEPFIAREQGGDPRALMLSDIGFNPYASLLVTSENVIQTHSEMVQQMVTACWKGWTDYLKSPESTNSRIHQENSDMSLAALQFGAESLQELCRVESGQRLGTMSEERWRTLVEQIEAVEAIDPGSVQAEDCFALKFLEQAVP